MSTRARRRRREVAPVTTAGLIRFYEGKEIENIKVSPHMVVGFAIALILSVVLAYLIGI